MDHGFLWWISVAGLLHPGAEHRPLASLRFCAGTALDFGFEAFGFFCGFGSFGSSFSNTSFQFVPFGILFLSCFSLRIIFGSSLTEKFSNSLSKTTSCVVLGIPGPGREFLISRICVSNAGFDIFFTFQPHLPLALFCLIPLLALSTHRLTTQLNRTHIYFGLNFI